jgi:hypothetical protein
MAAPIPSDSVEAESPDHACGTSWAGTAIRFVGSAMSRFAVKTSRLWSFPPLALPLDTTCGRGEDAVGSPFVRTAGQRKNGMPKEPDGQD